MQETARNSALQVEEMSGRYEKLGGDEALLEVNEHTLLNRRKPSEEEPEPYKRIILVTISMFMGYAILISFQHKLKERYCIRDTNDSRSHVFGIAVSMLYVGNLIFRMAHNFVFAWLKPRNRVFMAMTSMATAMLVLGGIVFQAGKTSSLAWVWIAYLLGGMGIGSFESNLLSSITPLGHPTKMWAIIGFPVGFAVVLIGGFSLTAPPFDVPPEYVYFIVLGALVCGATVFAVSVPNIEIENNASNLKAFVENARHWREWLPQIGWHCLALQLNMLAVSLFSGVLLYLFDNKRVPLFGHGTSSLPHDWYFVIYNCFTLAGDSLSRRVAYVTKPRHPMIYLVLSILGATFCLSEIGILGPPGIFMVFFANGSIYATTTRHIDTYVLKEFNLIALSFWLFVGDFGSVAGANLISYVRVWFCPHEYRYICHKVASNFTC